MNAFLEDVPPAAPAAPAAPSALAAFATLVGLEDSAVTDAHGSPCDVYDLDLGGPPGEAYGGAAFYGAAEIGEALSAFYDDGQAAPRYDGGDDDEYGGWMHGGADGARYGGGAAWGGVEILAWAGEATAGGGDEDAADLAGYAGYDSDRYYSDYYSDDQSDGRSDEFSGVHPDGAPAAVGGGGDAEWEARFAEMTAGAGADYDNDEY